MLNWKCRRFRARFTPRFTPGIHTAHRRSCPECDAYATALEQAAGLRLPLPERLRDSLRGIAQSGSDRGSVLDFRLPQIPLPEGLHARLRAIPSEARQEGQRPAPPEWVRSPRYAVAASALLALLLGAAVDEPWAAGREAAVSLEQELRDRVAPLEAVQDAAAERLAQTRRSIESSVEKLIPSNTDPDPESDAPGRSRRTP
jgi:hypothetical protein